MDSSTQALLDQAAIDGYTPASGNVLTALDDLIIGLKALDNSGTSAWDSLDYLVVMWTNGDRNFALYDLKSATKIASEVGTPTFSQYKGFIATDGTSYIDLNWNVFDDAVEYQQNNASHFQYLNTDGTSFDEISGIGFRNSTRSAVLAPNRTAAAFQGNINSTISNISNWTIADSDRLSKGFYMMARPDSSNEEFYNFTGNLIQSRAQGSNSPIATDWATLGYNNNGTLVASRSGVSALGMGRYMGGIASDLSTLFDDYVAAAVNEEANVVELDLNIVFDGDSRVRGQDGTPDGNENIATALQDNHLSVSNSVRSYEINSFGVNGQTISQMESNAASKIDPNIDVSKTNILIFMEGTNSIINNAQTAATTYAQHETYMTNRRAAGWDIIIFISEAEPRVVGGVYNSANFTSGRLQELRDFDALYENESSPLFDGLIRLREKPLATVGGDIPAEEVNIYWSDSVHYLQIGYEEVASIIWTDQLSILTPPEPVEPTPLYYDNDYNFVRWYNVESSNFTESIIPELLFVESDIVSYSDELSNIPYHPIIAKDETVRWYFNSESLVSEPIGNLFLFFIDKDGIRASSNITGINSDIISGSDYRPYMDLTIPELSNSGSCYRMVVASSSKVILISNMFNYSSNENVYGNKSFIIRYRNNKDMLNFGYENTGLESFYNQIRIKLKKQNPKNDVQDNGYDLVNGRFNRVRTSINKNYNWFTYYMDSFGHDAMNASLVHSDFEIFEFGEYVRYYLGDNSYNQDSFEKEFPLTQADFTLTKVGGSSFKTL